MNTMDNTFICSPPVSTEKRLFHIPGGDMEDTFFTFHFNIEKTGKKSEIAFTLELNPMLRAGDEAELSSPPRPEKVSTYQFAPKGQCFFHHITAEGYYVKGGIEVIKFNNAIGQFDENYKNFYFKIETGLIDDTPHDIRGLFGLINPEADQSGEFLPV